ncbi:MAG: methionine sulfoxide reductase A [Methylophaga sp.]|nr:MAG: methionine sulfoxide reductase A [Methylophaga sp.]
MVTGKSIRIYLPSGSINGIRHAEIANWTGQALSCPRSEIKSLNDWDEVNSPGVYFLFGADDDGQHQAVYIGEAENVRDRLKNHVSNKDFWNEVICFTNKDESLTKSHVKYLEAILIEQAKDINRYHIQNTISPNKPTLPRADRDAMNEFANNVRILLGALGHKTLESYATITATPNNKEQTTKLRLLNKNAFGERVSDGFLVHQGSEMALTQSDAQRKTTIILFEQLIKEGIVVENKESYDFAQQYLFSSPSYAASLLNGYPTNGLDAWKNEQGQTLKEIEAS